MHAQLLAYAATWGPATALGGMHRVLGKRPPDATGASAWTPEDIEQARAALPKHRQAMLDKPSPHVLAATALGISRKTLYRKIREYHIM